MTEEQLQVEIEKLKAAQAGLPGLLPDKQIENMLQELQTKLGAFEQQLISIQERGVYVGNDVHLVVTGDGNTIYNAPPAPDYTHLQTAYLNHQLRELDQLALASIDASSASDAKSQLALNAV